MKQQTSYYEISLMVIVFGCLLSTLIVMGLSVYKQYNLLHDKLILIPSQNTIPDSPCEILIDSNGNEIPITQSMMQNLV